MEHIAEDNTEDRGLWNSTIALCRELERDPQAGARLRGLHVKRNEPIVALLETLEQFLASLQKRLSEVAQARTTCRLILVKKRTARSPKSPSSTGVEKTRRKETKKSRSTRASRPKPPWRWSEAW